MRSKRSKTLNRLIALLATLCLLFGVSVVAIAAGGGGNPGLQPNMVGGLSNFQLRLSDPDTTMNNEGGTYLLSGTYDANETITFEFSMNPQGGQKNFPTDGNAMFVSSDNGVISIYPKSEPSQIVSSANYSFSAIQNVSVAFNNERRTTLTINAGALENGNTYVLYIPSNLTSGAQGKTLGYDVLIEFVTAAETDPGPDPEPEVTPFTLSTSEVTIEKGATTPNINVNNYQSDAHGTLTAESKDTSIATVRTNQLNSRQRFTITGVAPGTTQVVVSSEDGQTTATCTVTVTAPSVKSIAMNKTSLTLDAGKSDSLSAIILPNDAGNQEVTWSSSDTSAATVDENGVVTSVNGGSATITATTTDGGKTAVCVVNPVEESINYAAQGNNGVLSVQMTNPKTLTTTRLSNGDYWNVSSQEINLGLRNNVPGATLGFSLIYGTGLTHNYSDLQYLCNKVSLYRDKELSDKVGTFTKMNDNPVNITGGGGVEKSSFSLYASELSPDTTYYLVFQKDLEVNDVPLGNNIIVEFHTKKAMDSLTLDKTELTMEEGTTDKLTATQTGPDEGFIREQIQWSSSDETVVTVNNGNLTAVGAGSATITAKAPISGKTATCAVTVNHVEETLPAKEPTCTEPGLTEGKKCSVCGEILEEQKEIPAKGHTEEVIPGKDATCTEPGLTEGKKCSVCGEVLEEQKEIPAKGHTEETIPGKAATCTEKGLTDGKKCSVCGEILEEQKEIPALGHEYKDGVCTRCGEKDPSYVEPTTPEEPADTDLVVKTVDGKQIAVRGTKSTEKASDYTGIAPELGNKKVWWRVVDGDVVPDATGVFKNEYGWWRVENGKVNFDAQGIYKNDYGWWKTTNGKVTFDETGVFQNEYGWWRVEDSKVNFKANGIYKNDYGWWKTTKGKVTFKENGVFKNEYGWWKVEKSKVNFNFTGIASNEYGTWYVKNGKVDFSKNGKVTYNGKTYNVTDGKAKLA